MKRGSEAEMGGGPSALSVSPRVESRWRKLLDAFPTESFRNESLQMFPAERKVRVRGRRVGMDITWVTDRIAVGGGIWNADNMAAVSGADDDAGAVGSNGVDGGGRRGFDRDAAAGG